MFFHYIRRNSNMDPFTDTLNKYFTNPTNQNATMFVWFLMFRTVVLFTAIASERRIDKSMTFVLRAILHFYGINKIMQTYEKNAHCIFKRLQRLG